MDKRDLVQQLTEQLSQSMRTARKASADAASEAMNGASPAEKRESARVALEYSHMAKAQSQRERRTRAELDALEMFRPGPLSASARVSLGAIVEVEDDDTGEGRTIFVAPHGAGITLSGPGGDGLLSVVTPRSPMGMAVVGRMVGDSVDVTIRGDVRAYTLTYVG